MHTTPLSKSAATEQTAKLPALPALPVQALPRESLPALSSLEAQPLVAAHTNMVSSLEILAVVQPETKLATTPLTNFAATATFLMLPTLSMAAAPPRFMI
jgi:hypothetical protein